MSMLPRKSNRKKTRGDADLPWSVVVLVGIVEVAMVAIVGLSLGRSFSAEGTGKGIKVASPPAASSAP